MSNIYKYPLVKKALVKADDAKAMAAVQFNGKPLPGMARIILKPGITMSFGRRAIA